MVLVDLLSNNIHTLTLSLVSLKKKSHIRETPTLSTNAGSGTDTNLKKKRDL